MSLFEKITASPLRRVYDAMPESLKARYRILKLRDMFRKYQQSPGGLAQTRRILEPRRNTYKGKRLVLMGNGPSLRNTNWSLLKNEYTIGMNRIYLIRDEMGFSPSFYVCVNELLIDQFLQEILELPCLKVLDWGATAKHSVQHPDLVCLPLLPTPHFTDDITTGWYQGCTVTFAAMQLAYYLGFSQIILIGVDHRFSTKGPPNQAVVSQGPDPNHFHPDYFGKGIKWQLPDLVQSEHAYRMAKAAFEDADREIIDCTLNGALTIFPKRRLEDVL